MPGPDNTEKQKRLSPYEYEEVKTKWSSGRYSLSDLSEEYGITVAAIQRRLKKDGIEKGQSRDILESAERHLASQNITTAAMIQAEKNAREISEAKELRNKSLKFIEQLTSKTLYDAHKDNKPYASTYGDLKAIGQAAKNLDMVWNGKRELYGIDKADEDDDIPELVIRSMSEEDEEALRAKQTQENIETLGQDMVSELTLED